MFDDLAAETTYADHATILPGVGQTENVTLKLQNPRDDGVSPMVEHWFLQFNPNVIHVSLDGKQVLPGEDAFGTFSNGYLSRVEDTQTYTLVIESVGGGETDLTAYTYVWSGTLQANGGLTTDAGWYFGAQETVHVGVPVVNIDTDSNNDGVIDHATDDPIENDGDKTGKVIELHVEGGGRHYGTIAEADLGWTFSSYDAEMVGTLTSSGGISVWTYDDHLLIDSGGGSVEWDFNRDTVPFAVHVRGDEAGTATLTWSITSKGASVGTDTVKFTVLELDDLIVSDTNNGSNVVTATLTDPEKNMAIVQGSLQASVGAEVFFDPMSFGANGTGKFIHVTISGAGQTILDTTCENTHFFASQSLTALAADGSFTVFTWLDINRDGVREPNEDYRLVSVYVIDPALEAVDFNATDPTKFHPITHDPAPAGSYGPWEWEDDNHDGDADEAGEHKYPVCYTASGGTNGDVKLQDQVKVAMLGTLPAWLNVTVRGTGVVGGDGGETYVNLSQTGTTSVSSGAVIATVRSDEDVPSSVQAGMAVLAWEVSFDGGATWVEAGTSYNRTYLTWHDPILAGPLYETLLCIGCNAASGETSSSSQSDVVNAVWSNGFAGLSVHKVDGTLMTYTHEPGYAHDYDQMLGNATGYGQCTAWAQLMVAVLGAQGIDARTRDMSAVNPYDEFRVIAMPAQGSGGGNYTYAMEFGFHEVVAVDGFPNTIFDPSYGSRTDKTDSRWAEQKYEDLYVTHIHLPAYGWVSDPTGPDYYLVFDP